jgi:hypothetical protein
MRPSVTTAFALVFAGTSANPVCSQGLLHNQGRSELRAASVVLPIYDELFGRAPPPRSRPKASEAIPLPRPAPAGARLPNIPIAPELLADELKANAPGFEPPMTAEPGTAKPATVISPVGSNPATAHSEVLDQFVKLRAEHASLGELLAQLAGSFKLTYRLPPSTNRRLNGLYSGSLGSVLARILDGTDYFVKTAGDEIEVIVPGDHGRSAVPTTAASTAATDAARAPPLGSFLTEN